ncbi:MAG: glycosyltransferase, partial [Dehalococcoidia bacterium]
MQYRLTSRKLQRGNAASLPRAFSSRSPGQPYLSLRAAPLRIRIQFAIAGGGQLLTIQADTNDSRAGRNGRHLNIVAPSTNGAHRTDASERVPVLSIIVPTRNEAGNIPELARRLRAVPLGGPTEIIFVDDSDDDTPAAVQQLPDDPASSVVLLHRRAHEREGGLGGAVAAGV